MSVRRILVRTPNWIGDQVMAYPFFYYLRRLFPDAEIVSCCVPWVESLQFRDCVDGTISLPRPEGSRIRDRFAAIEAGARLLKQRGPWDLAFSLPDSFSAGWMLARSGAARRIGYRGDMRAWLLNEAIEPMIGDHRAQAYLGLLPAGQRVAAREFWGVPPENDLDPGIPGVLPAFDPAKAWPGAHPIEIPPGDYWVLAPGAVAETRRWPAERFSDLADRICGDRGWTCVIVGGPGEAQTASRIREMCRAPLLDLTSKGEVCDYWKVFRHAKFTIANDSGLAHVASLCGSPVQIVWGAGDPKRTEPLGPGRVRVMFNPVSCWPCERNVCSQPPERRLECLRGIESEALWEEVQSGILRSP